MPLLPMPLKSPVSWIVQLVGTFPTNTLEEIVPPFISHIATLPLVSRQRMSALPSPLKSRWPTIDQVVGTVATDTPEETAPPFISHIATLPLVSRQRMSLLPSPLKSWAADCTKTHAAPSC